MAKRATRQHIAKEVHHIYYLVHLCCAVPLSYVSSMCVVLSDCWIKCAVSQKVAVITKQRPVLLTNVNDFTLRVLRFCV